MCAELTVNDVGKTVTVMGWCHKSRNLGGLIFVTLRDRTGIIQVVFDNTVNSELFAKAEGIRGEYVLAVVGEVVKRSPEAINPKLPQEKLRLLQRN